MQPIGGGGLMVGSMAAIYACQVSAIYLNVKVSWYKLTGRRKDTEIWYGRYRYCTNLDMIERTSKTGSGSTTLTETRKSLPHFRLLDEEVGETLDQYRIVLYGSGLKS